MKKAFITLLLILGAYSLWRFIRSVRQEKLSLSEAGQKALQTVQSAWETNIRVPPIAQVGMRPLTGVSLNPVSTSFADNPVYAAGPKQLAPRQAGSLQFSAVVSGTKTTTEIVPQRFSSEWFALMGKNLQN